VLARGAVRCWGTGGINSLGYGNTDSIGDDELPASAGDVPLGPGTVVDVATGGSHICARFAGGGVRCWGGGAAGQLGQGTIDTIGDDELPESIGDIALSACTWPVQCTSSAPFACAPDPFEPNDTRGAAAAVGQWTTNLTLCPGEDDWYAVPVADRGLGRMQYHVALYHDSIGDICGLCTLAVEACPSNTVSVDIYNAQTGALLATQTRTRGFSWLQGEDEQPVDLLIRVYGGASAGFPYNLEVIVDEWISSCDNGDCALPEFCDTHC
jgi:hypothetical protein